MTISDNPKFVAMAKELARVSGKHERKIQIECTIDDVFYWGAAAAFGLMGMAHAIQQQYSTWRCSKCGTWRHETTPEHGGLCKCPWPSLSF